MRFDRIAQGPDARCWLMVVVLNRAVERNPPQACWLPRTGYEAADQIYPFFFPLRIKELVWICLKTFSKTFCGIQPKTTTTHREVLLWLGGPHSTLSSPKWTGPKFLDRTSGSFPGAIPDLNRTWTGQKQILGDSACNNSASFYSENLQKCQGLVANESLIRPLCSTNVWNYFSAIQSKFAIKYAKTKF